jgi:Intraflagellar transport complex B, subunit 20
MAEDKVQISFDEDCRIRVLDPEVFKHSEELEEDCKGFVSKIQVCCLRQHRLCYSCCWRAKLAPWQSP